MMLEQEIEKYLSGQTLCNCDSVSYRNIKNLILGFADPREKRIADLELKIKMLTQHLEPQSMTTLFEQVEEEVKQEQRLNKLEKENAELKENNKSYEEIIDNSSTALMKEKLKNYKQLSKAKKLIRDLLSCLYSVEYDRVSNLEEAEAFLKEVSE